MIVKPLVLAIATLLSHPHPLASMPSFQKSTDRGISVKKPDERASSSTAPSKSSDRGLGLNYALFTADPSGGATPIGPGRVLADGDRVRLVIEPHTDACLYVFDQEGEGDLRLIFPNLRIRRGAARVLAHVPLSLPGSGVLESDWFRLTGPAIRERLVIVLAASPIEGWPADRSLLEYPTGFSVSRRDFDETALEPAVPTAEGRHQNSLELRQGSQRDTARGATVRSEETAKWRTVTAHPEATKLIVRVELRRG